MRNEDTFSRENIIEALKILDIIEDSAEDPNYDLLLDAKRLNNLIPGIVYGKSTDHIRHICNELLGVNAASV